MLLEGGRCASHTSDAPVDKWDMLFDEGGGGDNATAESSDQIFAARPPSSARDRLEILPATEFQSSKPTDAPKYTLRCVNAQPVCPRRISAGASRAKSRWEIHFPNFPLFWSAMWSGSLPVPQGPVATVPRLGGPPC